MKKGEQVLGAVMLLFSLFILWQTTTIESGEEFGMGPAFMPYWLSVILALLSVGIMVRATTQPASNFDPFFFVDRPGAQRLIAVLVAFLISLFLIEPLGTPIALIFMMATMVPLLGGRNWVTVALAALLTAIGVYLVFGRALSVPLPMGVLSELLPLY